MPWSSKVKSLTHKFVKEITDDEAIADFAGHYVGGCTALITMDASYPVIQTTKWVAQEVIKEIAQPSEKDLEKCGDMVEHYGDMAADYHERFEKDSEYYQSQADSYNFY